MVMSPVRSTGRSLMLLLGPIGVLVIAVMMLLPLNWWTGTTAPQPPSAAFATPLDSLSIPPSSLP